MSTPASSTLPPVSRPLSWVASILYVAVLVAGGYFHLAGLADTSMPRTAGFIGVLLVLLASEVAERRRYPVATPRRLAIALLVARTVLYALAATLDSSGFARALFLVIPFAAYVTLGARVSVALAAACVGLVAVRLPAGWYHDQKTLSDLLMFVVGLVLAVAMASVAVRAQAYAVQTRSYAAQLATLAATNERNRLARDLHDSLGHHLTAISVQLEKAAAYRHRDEAASAQALADARASARYALADVRHSVGSLRGGMFSLRSALSDMVRTDPVVSWTIDGEEHGYSPGSLVTLYRVAQEALTNIRRHAAAARVTVRLCLGEAEGRLEIVDDGCGFVVGDAGSGSGYGLRGMAERLEQIGGSLRVTSRPGAGTSVTATVPAAAVPALA